MINGGFYYDIDPFETPINTGFFGLRKQVYNKYITSI